MTYDIAEERRKLDQKEEMQRQFLAATGRPNPFQERIKGAIFTLIAPRLALDAKMPDLDPAVAGIDRGNFHHHRKAVADSVRRAVRGRLGRDADIEDIEALLAALEDDDDGEAQDRRGRRARDEVERPGFGEPEPPEDDPFSEAEAEDSELEELKSQMSPACYDRLRRRASDRRRARDAEPSPYENFDRKRTARDDPMFPGAPRVGGSMYPMENANVDRPGFGAPKDVAAKDKRPGRFDARPRSFGQDAAPSSFERRFRFTGNATTGRPTMPGIKVGAA